MCAKQLTKVLFLCVHCITCCGLENETNHVEIFEIKMAANDAHKGGIINASLTIHVISWFQISLMQDKD